MGKAEGGVAAAAVRHGVGACSWWGGQRVAPTPTMCCTCRPPRYTNKDLQHVRTWQAGWIIQRKAGARWHTVGTQLARAKS